MAISFRVGSNYNSGSVTGAVHAVPYPTGIVANDRIFLAIGSRGTPNAGDMSSPWELEAQFEQSPTARNLAIWSKQADGTEGQAGNTTVNVSFPNNSVEIQCGFVVLAGVNHANRMNVTPIVEDNPVTNTSHDAPAITPDRAGTWIAYVYVAGAGASWTASPAGTNERVNSSALIAGSRAVLWADKVGPAGGVSSGTGVATTDVTSLDSAITMAINPEGGETLRPTATRNVSAAFNPNVDPAAYQALDEDPDESTLLDPLTLTNPSGSSATHPAQDPNTPSLAVTGFTATTLTSEANVFDTSDTTAATHAPATNTVDYGRYFQFPAADFTGIPANAVITGMTVRVRASASTNNRLSLWMQAMASNGGTVIGSEGQADGGTPISTTVADYGANTVPALNAIPTRAQLVSGTFGIRLRWRRSNTVTLSLFRIQVTVSYSIPGTTLNTKAEVLMGDPVGALMTGTASGEIRLAVNGKGSPDVGAGSPTVRAEIHENASATVLATPIPDTTVSSSGSVSVFSGTFDQSIITNKNNVEVWLIGTGVAGMAVEFDAVEWNAKVTSAQNLSRTITDSLGITDAASKVQSVVRALTDTLGITDSTLAGKLLTKSVSDNIGLLDNASVSKGRLVTITDNLGIVDSRTLARTLAKNVTDNLGITDNVAQARAIQRAVTDAIGILDNNAVGKLLSKSVTDNLGMTDSAGRSLARTRIITDNLGILDTPTKALTVVLVKSVTDTLGISDNANKVMAVQRAVTDSLGITDTRALTKTVARSITDNLGITDNRVLSRAVARVVTDSLGMTDNRAKSQTYVKSVTDSLGITDAASKQLLLIINRVINDNIGITDNRSVVRNINRAVNDNLGITDNRVIAKTIARSINDTLGATDSLIKTMTRSRVITDALGVTDSTVPVKTSFIQRTITDNLGITDNASKALFRLIARTVNDSIGITDNVNRARGLNRTRTDTLGLSDSTSKAMNLVRAITDELGIVDDAEYDRDLQRIINDVVSITDDSGTEVARFVEITDLLGIQDGVEWRVIGFTVAPFMTAELMAIPAAQAELLGSPSAVGQLIGIPAATGEVEA